MDAQAIAAYADRLREAMALFVRDYHAQARRKAALNDLERLSRSTTARLGSRFVFDREASHVR
jgi:hypothetical protein